MQFYTVLNNVINCHHFYRLSWFMCLNMTVSFDLCPTNHVIAPFSQFIGSHFHFTFSSLYLISLLNRNKFALFMASYLRANVLRKKQHVLFLCVPFERRASSQQMHVATSPLTTKRFYSKFSGQLAKLFQRAYHITSTFVTMRARLIQ